ncbi:F-box/kelch-repeat protein At3g23880-like [Papaver somniferum]|uniref:F-box/kelch-repeat protein At3g23880-like n=1 Tax=Papaver somniferum TaxID=3469 RepID=UPI000E6FD06F|nr:F-box/kelch-repeat protein At3g23880-like [Papaver somniferum]
MESLPIEIPEYIFTRLPLESTLQCKRVCKIWRTLIGKGKVGMLFSFERISTSKQKSRNEVQLFYGDRICYHPREDNLEKYDSGDTLTHDFDKKEVSLETLVLGNTIVGSCNGLICFWSPRPRAFVICNPVTGEHVFLPRNRAPEGGFGYLESKNEYKVVSFYFDRCKQKRYAHVYTLGSRAGWTIVQTNYNPYILNFNSSGIFANGAIHWLNVNKNSVWDCKIVALDLADEKFKFVPSPPLDYNTARVIPKLVLLGKNLCTVFHHTGSDQGIDIWSLKIQEND